MARPRLSEADEHNARKRLADLALALYLADGMEGVSLRKLAESAKVSHTYVYRYFSSMSELLVAMRVVCTRQFVAYIREADDPRDAPRKRLKIMSLAIAQYGLEHEPQYRLLFALDQPPPDQFPELLQVRQELAEHVAQVASLAQSGTEEEPRPMVLAHTLWAGVHGILSLHLAGQLVHGHKLDELLSCLLEPLLRAQES